MWDLDREENFVLNLDGQSGYDSSELITCVAYSKAKGKGQGSTSARELARWQHSQHAPTLFYNEQNYLDRDLDDIYLDNIYMGHSLFNTTKRVTLLFIVTKQSTLYLDYSYPHVIQIECLHGTKFLDPDRDVVCDPDNLACKRACNSQPVKLDNYDVWKGIWVKQASNYLF